MIQKTFAVVGVLAVLALLGGAAWRVSPSPSRTWGCRGPASEVGPQKPRPFAALVITCFQKRE